MYSKQIKFSSSCEGKYMHVETVHGEEKWCVALKGEERAIFFFHLKGEEWKRMAL
jgi:hypothetical protein